MVFLCLFPVCQLHLILVCIIGQIQNITALFVFLLEFCHRVGVGLLARISTLTLPLLSSLALVAIPLPEPFLPFRLLLLLPSFPFPSYAFLFHLLIFEIGRASCRERV